MTALANRKRLAVRTILALLVAMLSLAASPASAGWWNKEWSYRKAVTIDTTASGVNISGAIGRTVVLVRLHSGNFTFTDALDNGADLRIVDGDDKTPLPFHIESFNAKDGIATLWVSVPALNGGEKKKLWIYFGNANAKVGEDAAGTFDPDYVAVYHFGENPGQPAADRTANANNANGAVPGVDEGGIVGRAARFPGQGAIAVNPTPSLAIPAGTPFTVSAWVKPEQIAGNAAVFSRGGLVVGLNGGMPYASVGGATLQATAPVKQGDWSLLALVADGTTVKLYVNGVEAAAGSAALPAFDAPFQIGGAEGSPFTGAIDELRLSKVARPATMLLAQANAEGPGGKLVAVAESAEKPGGGGGVFFFVLGKLEGADIFVVAGIMILLVMALALTVFKIRYLNICAKANAVFRKRFNEMHEELVPIAEVKGISQQEVKFLANSPLARLYAIGIDELRLRQKARGARPLMPQAVEAMRSAADAQVVAENHRLDNLMVILTIAISGGPFIGLLGTVIGVMSTFGGVAIAGDVNVNAIAPGIAAALLATVAGMSCAIPSLFAYNYMNSRISTMADEMRVFVDRLITRLAEMQAESAEAAHFAQAAE